MWGKENKLRKEKYDVYDGNIKISQKTIIKWNISKQTKKTNTQDKKQ